MTVALPACVTSVVSRVVRSTVAANYNVGVKRTNHLPRNRGTTKVDALRGLNISITTTAKNDEECKALLAAFKFPFKN